MSKFFSSRVKHGDVPTDNSGSDSVGSKEVKGEEPPPPYGEEVVGETGKTALGG